jgi:glycine/D-amino acid oxidase-like deaminating enzyme
MNSSTFPNYPDSCGWNALLPARTARPRATGAIAVKYAVVGAGYTGLAAARRLSELDPGADIAIFEATTVGEGSSARNSGFAGPRDIPAGTSAAELQRAAALNRFGEEGFAWLAALIGEHGIDCELQLTGRIKGAATVAGARVVRGLHATVAQLGLPHALLDAEQLQERIGTRYYRCGLYTEGGYLLQPAALIRGLADCLPVNVRLHENSPVMALRRHGKWQLQTPDANITADCVVMATNAAVTRFGYLRDRLVTIYTYAGITEALAPEDAAQLGSMANWGLLPAHRLGTTVRRVGNNRLMVRSLYAYERDMPARRVHAALLACFRRRYPALAHAGLEYVWGGTTALTLNGAPYWGRLDDGLYASAGCNGAGIVKGTVLGKRLAELITGLGDQQDVRAAYGTASWVVPEPFRSIGFSLTSAVQRRKAGLEA